jgi:hypothetical protein
MDRGRAPAIPGRPGEAGEGRLARHLPALRDDADPDASGQPRPEVLPPAEQPHAEEAEVQPLRRGTFPSPATSCRHVTPLLHPRSSNTSDAFHFPGRERRQGGELGAGRGAPGSVPRHQQAGGAVTRPASDPIVPAAAVLGANEQKRQRQHVAERNRGAEAQAPSVVPDAGVQDSSGAGPGAEDLDRRPPDRLVAEDALFRDHQGHITGRTIDDDRWEHPSVPRRAFCSSGEDEKKGWGEQGKEEAFGSGVCVCRRRNDAAAVARPVDDVPSEDETLLA